EDDVPAQAFRCGSWQAVWPGGSSPIELSGDGEWIDGLRTLCAAAWAAGHATEDMITPALKTLGESR
ncbi:MAG: hypothetical protein LBV34_00620, partial [Nocardiopsaceae bacterium]|nr:hypothetical protein [Nocardiopsaceae bacterium]